MGGKGPAHGDVRIGLLDSLFDVFKGNLGRILAGAEGHQKDARFYGRSVAMSMGKNAGRRQAKQHQCRHADYNRSSHLLLLQNIYAGRIMAPDFPPAGNTAGHKGPAKKIP